MARSARAQRRSGWRIVRVMVEAHRDHRSNAAPPPSAHDVDQDAHRAGTLTRTAFSATVHCLTGCAMGEVLGMVLGTAFAWANWMTVTVSVVLAFGFGYSLTMLPLIRAGLALRTAIGLGQLDRVSRHRRAGCVTAEPMAHQPGDGTRGCSRPPPEVTETSPR